MIGDLLPHYDAVERHSIVVRASPAAAYAALRRLDFARSPVIWILFALRGLPLLFRRGPVPRSVTLDDVLAGGFVLLAERPPTWLALGVVGRFWRLRGGIRRLRADEFAAFEEPGYAKAVWDFNVTQLRDGRCRVATETRVLCTDARSRRAFLRYWRIVGPFSGLIRVIALRQIKELAESASAV